MITLKIEGADVDVAGVEADYGDAAEHFDEPELTPSEASGPIPRAVADLLARVAPARVAEFERKYLERVITELDLDAQLPDSTNRRHEYVNLYPPTRYGARRASAFGFKSGRVEIYVSPSHATEFEHGEVVLHNGQPTWVRVYLTSDEAVDDAVALTKLGLSYR